MRGLGTTAGSPVVSIRRLSCRPPQSMVLAPLFVWMELLFVCGYRPQLQRDLAARIQVGGSPPPYPPLHHESMRPALCFQPVCMCSAIRKIQCQCNALIDDLGCRLEAVLSALAAVPMTNSLQTRGQQTDADGSRDVLECSLLVL